jgi:hypothetical protein
MVLGGTGFQPVVSGILPETWGAHLFIAIREFMGLHLEQFQKTMAAKGLKHSTLNMLCRKHRS